MTKQTSAIFQAAGYPPGVRLRWNWPLGGDAHPLRACVYPDRFRIQRTRALALDRLFQPNPNVGHLPRMWAPSQLWFPLAQQSQHDFLVDGPGCKAAQAVHVVMSPHGDRTSIALIDATGRTKLTGELRPGDEFYNEVPNIRRVSFSVPAALSSISGLSLDSEDAQRSELSFEDEIAVIDARAWLTARFTEVAERMSGQSHPPFVTISPQDWRELQGHARVLVQAIDQGVPLPMRELQHVELALASRWEIAALAGFAYLDGEHVAHPRFDKINTPAALAGPSDRVYGYRVVTDFRRSGAPDAQSDVAFARTRPMGLLSEARVVQRSAPRSRLVEVNQIDPVPGGGLGAPQPPVSRTVCSSSWTVETTAPYVEQVLMTPQASTSQITGGKFVDPSEFQTGDDATPPSFRGFDRIAQREHTFNVPYLDSDIWMNLAVGDCWDRRLAQAPTPKAQPDIDYEGHCLPLASGNCDPAKGTAALELVHDLAWRADSLAAFAKARIQLLFKEPTLEQLEADVTVFAPSPALDGHWRAELESDQDEKDLAVFAGGTLAVGGFKARILGFKPLRQGRYRCDFEAVARCAGADLYEAGPSGTPARLYEADGSGRVWHRLGAIPIQADGEPSLLTSTIQLPQLESSMMLYFSTRLAFEFEGKPYCGPTTARIAIPYVHPAPRPPSACVAIDALATDYYGRTLVRVTTTECEQFDPDYEIAVELAEGFVKEVAVFSTIATKGLFGPQPAFNHRVLFEVFSLLTSQAEGAVSTLGIRNFRPSDGRESEPDLRYFGKHRTD